MIALLAWGWRRVGRIEKLLFSGIEQNSLYTVNGQTVDIFKPEAPDDSSKNAYAMYDYLYQNPDAAKAFYGAQEYGQNLRGSTSNDDAQAAQLSHWANQDVLKNYLANDIIKQSDSDFYAFYGRTVVYGATAGVSAGVPFLEAANAIREGALRVQY